MSIIISDDDYLNFLSKSKETLFFTTDWTNRDNQSSIKFEELIVGNKTTKICFRSQIYQSRKLKNPKNDHYLIVPTLDKDYYMILHVFWNSPNRQFVGKTSYFPKHCIGGRIGFDNGTIVFYGQTQADIRNKKQCNARCFINASVIHASVVKDIELIQQLANAYKTMHSKQVANKSCSQKFTVDYSIVKAMQDDPQYKMQLQINKVLPDETVELEISEENAANILIDMRNHNGKRPRD